MKSEIRETEEIVFDYDSVPKIFWCKDYFFPGTKDVIPDANSCCFNHWVGLPKIDKERHPLYDYQENILAKLFGGSKYLCILKSPKLGITELILLYVIWKSCIEWEEGQGGIIVGTHMKEAENCIKRCRNILNNKFNPIPENKEIANNKGEFWIRNMQIVAHPANNADSVRSQPLMRFVLVDESAFFQMVDDKPVLDAAEHYMGSTKALILLVSTAGNEPKGFMYDIMNNEETNYERIQLTDPMKYGMKLHKDSKTCIYDNIEEIKRKQSYKRNYLGQWGAEAGNIFDYDLLKELTIPYKMFDPRKYKSALAVDPAYGREKTGSKFAVLGGVIVDGLLYFNEEKQFTNLSHSKALKIVQEYMDKGYAKLLIDAAHPALLQDFETLYEVKAMNFNESHKEALKPTVSLNRPIFKENLKMMSAMQNMVNRKSLRINVKTNKKLIEQLRAIKYDKTGLPDKTKIPFDLGDCARMLCYDLYEEPYESILI